MKGLFVLLITLVALCQHVVHAQSVQPDLTEKKNFTVLNRDITITKNDGKAAIHLNTGENDGVAWINNINFTAGVLEFDVKGRNMMQQSFVGIAFHGTNDSTFDIVYFRPFNFTSDDSTRRNHSVQYVSLPKYDWSYLRETFPGKYENKLTKTIEPEQWFHVKIIVSRKQIEVFVNNDDKPSLIVKPLNNNATGKIGFWVGNNSEGDFANLSIIKKS